MTRPDNYFQPNLTPCLSCPYRRDTPLMFWVREHYETHRKDSEDPFSPLFGCHKYRNRPDDEHVVCAGWLNDQKTNGVPCIPLRVLLISDKQAQAAIKTVSDGGHEVFPTASEMCSENLIAFEVEAAFGRLKKARKKTARKARSRPTVRSRPGPSR